MIFACRGVGVISIFPYDWSLEEQDSFARMSPRNPAGPAPLSSSSGKPGEEGIQPEADAWHQLGHVMTHIGTYTDFSMIFIQYSTLTGN